MTDKVTGDAFEVWANTLVQWSPPPLEQEEDENGGQDGWASSAKWFRAMREGFDAEKDPFLRFLEPWLTPSTTLLDIGAGAGRLSLPIAASIRKVIAVEASPAMREALREGIESQGAQNIEVVPGRWSEVELERVDVSLCANVLYDVADLRPFLINLDGIATRACFIYLTSRHPYDSFRELWQEFRGWTIPEGPTYEDAVRCLQQIGIEPNVKVIEAQSSASFADLDQAVAFAQRRLKLPEKPEIMERLRRHIAEKGEDKDGRWAPGWGRNQGIILWWEKA